MNSVKGQHDDLVEAEATLVQIIEELDTAMRKQFSEQFKRISEELILYSNSSSAAEKEHWN